MEGLRVVEITNGLGAQIEVELEFEGDREGGSITIEGINYHFERLTKERLLSDYKIDDDPDYQPQADAEGYCYLIAPFSESAVSVPSAITKTEPLSRQTN